MERLHDYNDADKLEDYGPADPGNMLRAKLSTVPVELTPEQVAALGELLYTAEERGIIVETGLTGDVEELATLIRLVALAQTITPQQLERVRM